MAHERVRHIVSLSGGKDSTALAIYLRDRIPDLEYVFCDTDKELPETYEYLERLEAYLGKPITHLKDGRGFDHWLLMRHNYLPSPKNRWCTQYLKLRPFENYVGADSAYNYIGIRADEDREGYISHKSNISPLYPFREAGMVKRDIMRLLDLSGLGLPDYYRWRTRSGCYFCFFQQKIEWVGLLENHPDLFLVAQQYEEQRPMQNHQYTWSPGETLRELSRPERVSQIRAEHTRRAAYGRGVDENMPLIDVLDAPDEACLICTL